MDGRKRRVGSREWTLLTLITRAGVWRRGRPDKPAIPSDVQAIRTPAAAGQSECGAAPPCDGDDRAGGAKAAIETNTRDPIVLQQQTVDAAGPLLVDNLSDSAPHVLEMLSRAPDCATDMARPRHRRHLRVKASDSGRRSRDRTTTKGRRSAPAIPGPARVTPDEAPARSLAFLASSKKERVRRTPAVPKAVRRANSAECVAVILDT